MNMNANGSGRVTLEAVVIRADGTREDLGIISTSQDPSVLDKIIKYLKGAVNHGR